MVDFSVKTADCDSRSLDRNRFYLVLLGFYAGHDLRRGKTLGSCKKKSSESIILARRLSLSLE